MTATETLAALQGAVIAMSDATNTLMQAAKAATSLALTLSREQDAKLADDDEWTRLPAPRGGRCKVSGWSRTTIITKCTTLDGDGKPLIRGKHIGTSRFYSLADARKLIAKS